MQETQESTVMEILNKSKTAWEAIKNYIPDADIKEIYIVEGLNQFLGAETEIDAFRAIIEGNGYFKAAIDFMPKPNEKHGKRLFDPEKLNNLIRKYAEAAIIQEQTMPEAARAQMQKWLKLFWKQEKEMMEIMGQKDEATKADKFNQGVNKITHRLQAESVQATVMRQTASKQIGE